MPFALFPLFPIVKDAEGKARCGCPEPDCGRAGKHPAYRYSTLGIGEDRSRPGYGVAILTGYKSNVFVVDTDGPEADARFRALGELPATFTVRTPSGGAHYYFTWPGFPVATTAGRFDRKPGEETSKIDIRGDVNGLVVAAGSPHKSGRAYTVESNVPVAAAPAWVLADPCIKGTQLDALGEGDALWRPFPVNVDSEIGRKRVAMGVEACTTYAPNTEESSNTLWDLSLRLIRDLELPIEVAASLVVEHYNPRCDSGWQYNRKEVMHSLEDARDASDMPPGMVSPFDLDALLPKKVSECAPISRKLPRAGHTYMVQIGDPPRGQGAKTNFANVCSVLRLHPDWAGSIQYDTFRDRVFAIDPPVRLDAEHAGYSDKDTDRLVAWFNLGGGMKGEDKEGNEVAVPGFAVAPDVAFRAAMLVASENSYHPVREWLESLPPVDGSHLDSAAEFIFGRKDALEATMLKRFMVAAVRRILVPGTKVDNMLVLTGPQGAGKSTFVRALFGEEWTAEDLPALDKKDAVEVLRGKWCVEVAELDKVLRVDAETAKAFLSRCVDTFRPSYGRSPVDRPRETVFVGTTNRDDFLKDATGSRRYWVIPVDAAVNLAWVRDNRHAMWAAALDLVRKGEQHWLTDEEDAERDARSKDWEERDPWHSSIVEYLVSKNSVTAEEVFKFACGGSTESFDRKNLLRVTDTLRKLGCEKKLEGQGKRKLRKWSIPSELSQLATLTPVGDPKLRIPESGKGSTG